MNDKLFLGIGKQMIAIPRFFIAVLGFAAKIIAGRKEKQFHKYMSDEHHAVRDFVVKELPRIGGSPMASEFIAEKLCLSVVRVNKILKRLERMIFIDMNERGMVTWAYPVTIIKTPHHAILSNGEQTFMP